MRWLMLILVCLGGSALFVYLSSDEFDRAQNMQPVMPFGGLVCSLVFIVLLFGFALLLNNRR